MRVKEGVDLMGLQTPIIVALSVADEIWRKYGIDEGVTVTSALDGKHKEGSLHYPGLAVDLRTRYFSNEICNMVANELRENLPDDFDVVLEATHIHLEYDKKG
jgi:hypothetical protein